MRRCSVTRKHEFIMIFIKIVYKPSQGNLRTHKNKQQQQKLNELVQLFITLLYFILSQVLSKPKSQSSDTFIF